MTKMPCIFNMSEHKLLLYLIFYLFSFIHYLTSDILHNIPSGLASYWFSRKAVFFTNKLLLYLIFYLFSFIHYLTSDILHNIPSGLASYWFSRKAVFFTNIKKYALIKLKQTSLKIISSVQWLIFL